MSNESSITITSYHAKYFAHELTKRCASDSVQKLAASLADAQVDLNPHQIDAALFAFRSPLSKGAILADEVGLGKTIEAGILLSQKWAERKRKLLVIVPANLRKQWHQELADKFFLPATILETRTFNEQIKKKGNFNPFDQPDTIVICSYHFAKSKDIYIQKVPWNLVVIDEAHRLRNVYKPANRIANAIKNAVAEFPKILLTATPLQNSLLELYGLVSVVGGYTFGDLKSFKAQFTNLSSDTDFAELKTRLKPICQRTLRRQVLEYVPYTNRYALVQEFFPTEEVSPGFETVDELKEEWEDDEGEPSETEKKPFTAAELAQMRDEVSSLREFHRLARSIVKNSKGEVLLTALKRGFAGAQKKGAKQKAVIFTESTRTQSYLRDLLEKTEYSGKIVLFNGSNADPKSKEIYRNWLARHAGTDRVTGSPTADMRAALVDCFRDEAIILIATEAAAEGINLQFCSIVVNYDLPWNPQRIEQRIGRFENWLWQITRFHLHPYARFEDGQNAFFLTSNPFPGEQIHPGPYRAGRNVEDVNIYRVGHPLAQRIIERCRNLALPEMELVFNYAATGRNIAVLDALAGKSGWLQLTQVSVTAFESEDYLIFSGTSDDGQELDELQCQRLFSLSALEGLPLSGGDGESARARLTDSFARNRQKILARLSEKNGAYFEAELDKLDRWGEDQRNSLKLALKELEEEIRETRKQARLAPNLPEKLKLEREKRQLETKRDEAWRAYEAAAREIEQRKDALMDEVERKLNQQIADNSSTTAPMHYATKELTASLQELTSKSEQQPGQKEEVLPTSIAAGEFTVFKEVESFLEKTQEYSAKTRNVHIGTY